MAEIPKEAIRIPIGRAQIEQRIAIPAHYFNAFANNLGDSDISSVLLLDGTPVAKINMSFTTAKTFARLLTELVETLESVTNHNIMVSREVAEGLRKKMDTKS